MPKQRKPRATKLDLVLRELDEETVSEFHELCQHNRSCRDLQRWLEERGKQVPLGSIQRWWRNTFPIGEKAAQLNALMLGYSQIDPHQALQFGLGMVLERLAEWNKEWETYSDHEKRRIEQQMPAMLREARSFAGALNEFQVIHDRQELEMAGADALSQELLIAFKDTAIEDALKEAIRGAIAKVEGR